GGGLEIERKLVRRLADARVARANRGERVAEARLEAARDALRYLREHLHAHEAEIEALFAGDSAVELYYAGRIAKVRADIASAEAAQARVSAASETLGALVARLEATEESSDEAARAELSFELERAHAEHATLLAQGEALDQRLADDRS